MQNFRQAYRPPESAAEPQAAERMKEVELAKPWQRLLAGAIDRILLIMLLVMFLLRIEYTRSYVQAEMPWLLLLLPVGLVAGLLLGVAQVFMMSRSGQSIGQKILRIRVITDTGANPGFAKYVLAREGFFFVVLLALCGLLSGLGLGRIVYCAVQLVYLIMLCRKRGNYQTPQDLMLQTLVVKV